LKDATSASHLRLGGRDLRLDFGYKVFATSFNIPFEITQAPASSVNLRLATMMGTFDSTELIDHFSLHGFNNSLLDAI
jgi:hypothetical protein